MLSLRIRTWTMTERQVARLLASLMTTVHCRLLRARAALSLQALLRNLCIACGRLLDNPKAMWGTKVVPPTGTASCPAWNALVVDAAHMPAVLLACAMCYAHAD